MLKQPVASQQKADYIHILNTNSIIIKEIKYVKLTILKECYMCFY